MELNHAHIHNDELKMRDVGQDDFIVLANDEMPDFAFNVPTCGIECTCSSSKAKWLC